MTQPIQIPLTNNDLTDPSYMAIVKRMNYTARVNGIIATTDHNEPDATDEEIAPFFLGGWTDFFAATSIVALRHPVTRKTWFRRFREWMSEQNFSRALNETGRA